MRVEEVAGDLEGGRAHAGRECARGGLAHVLRDDLLADFRDAHAVVALEEAEDGLA